MADEIDPSQFGINQSAGSLRRLRPGEQRAALAAQRQNDTETNAVASRELATQKFGLDKLKFAQDEQHFQQTEGRETALGNHKMSMDQQGDYLAKLGLLLKVQETRVKMEDESRKTESAIGALDYFGKLAPKFDPKRHGNEVDAMTEFQTQYNDGLAHFHDALDNPAVSNLLNQKTVEFQRFRDAVDNKNAEHFTGAAGQAYQKSLALYGDPRIAYNVAKGTHAAYTGVATALQSGHLLPGDLKQFTSPEGEFDADGANLLAAQRAGAQSNAKTGLDAAKEQMGLATKAYLAAAGKDELAQLVNPDAKGGKQKDIQTTAETLMQHLLNTQSAAAGVPADAAAPGAKPAPKKAPASVDDLTGVPTTPAPAAAKPAAPAAATPAPGKKLDADIVKQAIADAGGDRDAARAALTKQGYSF